MGQVLRTGKPIHGEELIIERPDGTRVIALVHIDPVTDKAGKVLGAINCFHETTELHKANEQLQRQQQDLEDFFENGAVALHLVGSDGTIVRANKAELALLGYTAEEYVGRNVSDFHADADVIADILDRLKRGEKLDKYPARLRAKDGSIRQVLITSNVQFRDGQFLNTRCFTIDITDMKRSQDLLDEREHRFRQLLEALPTAVYTTDAEGRITFYNQAAVDLAGRRPVLGSDEWCVTWKIYTPDGEFLPHDQCPMAVAIRENRPIRGVEAVAERPDGTRVPFLPYPTPLRDASGRLIGAVNVLVDISDRKSAETQQKVLLAELNHRVKNNLQMLHSLLRLGERDSNSAEAREVLKDASQRVATMAAAQSVLYEAGNPTAFDMQEFLQSICTIAHQAFPDSVKITCNASPGKLPNDTAMPLALIINELLTNAVKHGGKGHSEVNVDVALERSGRAYLLRVQDDGPGFDLTVARKRSSGLGLVQGLSEQLGGTFEVERAQGARCLIRFEDPSSQS